MKNLHIVRHSKSSWDLNVADIDRPLNDKGINNSYLVADRLKKLFPTPELAITSPACRAMHTAVIFARVMGISGKKITFDERIYSASTKELLQIIAETSDSINNLIIFGHNNTFTEISNYFLPAQIDNLPTSGVTSLTFNSSNWAIEKLKPIKTNVDFPKNDKFA